MQSLLAKRFFSTNVGKVIQSHKGHANLYDKLNMKMYAGTKEVDTNAIYRMELLRAREALYVLKTALGHEKLK
jgi:hypothetical protein